MRKWVLGLLLAGLSVPTLAATMYVSDQFTVPVRRGPSSSHRILHAGLPSGTPLEVIGEDSAAGFTQVRMPNGTEGWIETHYLSAQPVARDRLTAAERRVETLEGQLKTLRGTEGRASDLSKQTEKLQAELAEVRRISATSLANYEENKQLKTSNEGLQTQVTQLTERVRQLERNVMLRWMLAGGGLVLLGLMLGAWIKSRPKRSSWA
jgi:SH3 domain protein